MTIEIPDALSIHVRAALAAARPLLTWIVALGTYRDLYARARTAPGETFSARALQTLGIDLDVGAGDVLQIPSTGPLVVVANHPHGMLDGLALANAIERQRRDVRVLTNHLISQLPHLSELCLFVDVSERRRAAKTSRAGLRAAVRWLMDGHALIVFPSGTVAHETDASAVSQAGSVDRSHARSFLTGPSCFLGPTRRISDAPWHDTAVRLAARVGAPLLPAFIEGHNSVRFYRLGRIHPALRTLLLPRELLRKRGSRVSVTLGSVVDARQLATDSASATAALRLAVDQLADRSARMDAEVRALGDDCRLLAGGGFEVFCAGATRISTVLEEIGRLREVTFRAVGEGTGRTIDLDAFDQHYLHLFAWHTERREVVGAYRLGLADEIVPRHGIAGLYTSTLFRYDARLLARLAPAIELGRSFVREEYQRTSNALLLLWKGIATFVARSKRYRVLFGPVSISSRFGDTSQWLLRTFLEQNVCRRELADLVEAVTPPAEKPLPRGVDPAAITDVRALDAAIAGLEGDGKGVPVLLRQYLRLNAKLLGFNVDPAFGDALDALMMVDLADVSPAILTRYFGKVAAEELRSRLHAQPAGARQAA